MLKARKAMDPKFLTPPRRIPLNHLAILLVAFAAVYTMSFGREYPDSAGYYMLCEYIRGNNPGFADQSSFILYVVRPLVPWLVSAIPGSNYRLGFAFVNGILWILSSLFVYLSVGILFGEDRLSLISSLLFVVNPHLLVYGAAALTDMGGFFFVALFVFVYLSMRSLGKSGASLWVLLGIIAGLAALTRETTFVIAAMPICWELFVEKRLNPCSLVPMTFMIVFAFVWLNANGLGLHVYLEKYMVAIFQAQNVFLGRPHFLFSLRGIIEWVETFIWTFGRGVVALPFSVRRRDQAGFRFTILTAILLGVSTLIWTVLGSRFMFVMFFGVITLQSLGLSVLAESIGGRLGKLTIFGFLGYYFYWSAYVNFMYWPNPPYIASIFA